MSEKKFMGILLKEMGLETLVLTLEQKIILIISK